MKKHEKELRATMGAWAEGRREISMDEICSLLTAKDLLREWRVPQTSGITGDPAGRKLHVLKLGLPDVRMAFAASQSAEASW